MLNPKYFSSVTIWDRAVSAYSPTQGFTLCEQLSSAELLRTLEQNSLETFDNALRSFALNPDSTEEIQEALTDLDQMYNGWTPGALSRSPKRLEALQRFSAQRPVYFAANHERPSLPGSLLRIVEALESLDANRIYLDSDVNGLSLLLGENAEVLVGSLDERSNFWLKEGLKQIKLPNPVRLSAPLNDSPDCDCALITASHRLHNQQALKRAFEMTRPGATIAVLIRPPWDDAFAKTLKAFEWEVETHYRDIQHWLLPGGIVPDGGGDLAFLKRPDHFPQPLTSAAPAEAVRDQPYFTLDIDGLAIPPEQGDLLEFADRLAAISPFPEAFRSHHIQGDRHNLCWADSEGSGLTMEMRPRAGHLLITFLPYNETLEWTITVLVLQSLGSSTTRVRPARANWAGKTTLFA